jgi:hypothetical protein
VRRPKRVREGSAILVREGTIKVRMKSTVVREGSACGLGDLVCIKLVHPQMCCCIVNNDGACGAGIRIIDGRAQLYGVTVTSCNGSGLNLLGSTAFIAHSVVSEWLKCASICILIICMYLHCFAE